MTRPIVLWNPKHQVTSDESCTTIIKSTFPPPPIPPPYLSNSASSFPLSYIPPLSYFCIRKLVEYPDQIRSLEPNPFPLPYKAPESPASFDIIKALFPDSHSDNFIVSDSDPRLWSVVTQIYSGLPVNFRTYRIPLSDPHIPLLQHVPSSPDFSLITILEIPSCRHLTDDTVVELKVLHNLCVLDVSRTVISTHGILNLSRTLGWSDDDDVDQQRRGPWGLRILRLQHCPHVEKTILNCLKTFPLLSVVDLRLTKFTGGIDILTAPFKRMNPAKHSRLFHPDIHVALDALETFAQDDPLFPCRSPHILHIDRLNYGSKKSLATVIAEHPRFIPKEPDRDRWLPSHRRTSSYGEEYSYHRSYASRYESPQRQRRDREPRLPHEYDDGYNAGDTCCDDHECNCRYPSEYSDDGYGDEGSDEDDQDEDEDGTDLEDYYGEEDEDEDDGDYEAEYSSYYGLGPNIDDIVSTGALEQSSHEAALLFYTQVPSRMPIPPSLPARNEESISEEDSRFMLIRPPPSWHLLDSLPRPIQLADEKRRRRKQALSQLDRVFVSLDTEVVPSARNNTKSKGKVETVCGMINKRRKVGDGFYDGNESSQQQKQVPATRNPFRRPPSFAGPPSTSEPSSTASLVRKRSTINMKDSLGGTGTVTPTPVLKPISTIKVPDLPISQRPKKQGVVKPPSKMSKSNSKPKSRSNGKIGDEGSSGKGFDWGSWSNRNRRT
ncbi:hypothetical protein JAAARDRAFT_190979 [Jaapia argillacea MUCL 33604]|uniref:Uncharacterized protein n=1 Tax=Jaapia argillacea MUCL 33604 TaxID=933084 RepID=A0A067Q1H2_9AGAM|nr:hypothetical protein JAAARDRAFT_190979 [Jaapia argillacea MUCL 33604]